MTGFVAKMHFLPPEQPHEQEHIEVGQLIQTYLAQRLLHAEVILEVASPCSLGEAVLQLEPLALKSPQCPCERVPAVQAILWGLLHESFDAAMACASPLSAPTYALSSLWHLEAEQLADGAYVAPHTPTSMEHYLSRHCRHHHHKRANLDN